MNVIICSFASNVEDLTPRQQMMPRQVLAALAKDPRISTWAMGEHHLWVSVKALEEKGWIKSIPAEYPWHKYEITPEGQKQLKAMQEASGE